MSHIDELMQAIAALAAHASPVSADNLRRDLEAVRQRLVSGEYAETDFIARDVFDVQRRTREYFTYVAGWKRQAEQWQALLEAAGVARAGSLVELCPGWAPKIVMALARARYSGRIVLVDRNAESLAALAEFTSALVPALTLATVVGDVLADPAPVQGELVVANHLLDDLVLDRWARAAGHATQALYEDVALLREGWEGVRRDRAVIEHEFLPAVARALTRYVSPGGQLLVVHYASNVERTLGASEVSAMFAELFAVLGQALRACGFRDVPMAGIQPGISAFLMRLA